MDLMQPASAQFDGMQFFSTAHRAGAAYEIADQSGVDHIEALDDWEIEVRKGSRIVVARGSAAADYEEARDLGLDAANRGLDMLSGRGLGDFRIVNALDGHVAWWVEGTRPVVRLRSVPTVPVAVAPVTVRGGTPIVRPPAVWHKSPRFFRRAQTTDDLFDAYRNLYLALESLLGTIAPQQTNAAGKPTEGEGVWVRRALTVAGGMVSPSVHAKSGEPAPVDALWNEFYRDRRSALFHAKSSRGHLLPHGSSQRQEVVDSLQPISGLYLSLLDKVAHLKRPGNFLFASGWRLMTESYKDCLRIVATDDPIPFDSSQVRINPSGGRLVTLQTAHSPTHDRPFERSFLGVTAGTRLRLFSRVTRVCATADDAPLTAHIPEGALSLPLVNRLEVLLTLRAENVGLPRTRFAS